MFSRVLRAARVAVPRAVRAHHDDAMASAAVPAVRVRQRAPDFDTDAVLADGTLGTLSLGELLKGSNCACACLLGLLGLLACLYPSLGCNLTSPLTPPQTLSSPFTHWITPLSAPRSLLPSATARRTSRLRARA